MTTKIDVRLIVGDHIDTLRDEATAEISIVDLIVMFGVPAFLGVGSMCLALKISDPYIGTLVSIFSIFAGLLFNVLVLIYSLAPGTHEAEGARNEIRTRLLRQSFANISFTILVALASVATLGIALFAKGIPAIVVCGFVVFLSMNFTLSLLMVLKRLHVLLRERFSA